MTGVIDEGGQLGHVVWAPEAKGAHNEVYFLLWLGLQKPKS